MLIAASSPLLPSFSPLFKPFLPPHTLDFCNHSKSQSTLAILILWLTLSETSLSSVTLSGAVKGKWNAPDNIIPPCPPPTPRPCCIWFVSWLLQSQIDGLKSSRDLGEVAGGKRRNTNSWRFVSTSCSRHQRKWQWHTIICTLRFSWSVQVWLPGEDENQGKTTGIYDTCQTQGSRAKSGPSHHL